MFQLLPKLLPASSCSGRSVMLVFHCVLVLLLLFAPSLVHTGKSKKLDPEIEEIYETMSWREMIGLKKKPKEWENRKNKEAVSFNDMLEHMDRLDQYHEKLYQEEILSKSDVYIIAPVMAFGSGGTMEVSHTTLNPALYNEENFNIVFKLGDKYPVDKPFITIYLGSCKRRSTPKKNLLPIQGFFYDKYRKELIPTPIDPIKDQHDYDKALEKRQFRLHKTQDDAFYFRWQVPDEFAVHPSDSYCFVFDMSSVDPSTLKYGQFHKLSRRKPRGLTPLFRSKWNYHQVKVSSVFTVKHSPELFTVEWFSRQYGGVDLERFMGGEMFCFKFFQVLFQYGSRGETWNSDVFHDHVNDRAEKVAKWFSTVIDETSFRFEKGFTHKPRKYDAGYANAEDRRNSRMRALGLLYHPQGRQSLRIIGKAFVGIANEYESANSYFGSTTDLISKIKQKMLNSWTDMFGGFTNARYKLSKHVEELNKLCRGKMPTEELLLQMTEEFGGKTTGSVKMPITNEYVTAPMEIRARIIHAMNILVENEIRLIMWKMGEILLDRKSQTASVLETFTPFSMYNYPKHFVYAAVFKTYGTKFEWMSKNYAVYGKKEYSSEEEDQAMSITSLEEN